MISCPTCCSKAASLHSRKEQMRAGTLGWKVTDPRPKGLLSWPWLLTESHRITESLRLEKPPRSSSPAINPPTPRLLNDIWKTLIFSNNGRIIEWFGLEGTIKDHLFPPPTPSPQWVGTPPIRPGFSKPHPAWTQTFPMMGHPQLLWATCSDVSPHSL